MEGIFFIDILDSFDDLFEVVEGCFLREKYLFFKEFGKISFTVLHNKVEAFLGFLGFVHSGYVGAFG
jgi:hypothetical protein